MMARDPLKAVEAIPRQPLLDLPTPLERVSRLSDALGISLWFKRDDIAGIGAGGNKLRKLELILGEALAEGVTWLITTGGPQSNHARLTAAVAARLGLGCSLFLRGPRPAAVSGNLMLDHLFGAEIELLGECTYEVATAAMETRADELRRRGQRPIVIPLGGANAVGTIGYIRAFREILEQTKAAGSAAEVIVIAAGTGSTFAGLECGAHFWRPSTRVVGISVSWTVDKLHEEITHLAEAVGRRLGIAVPSMRSPEVRADFIGPGYAQPSTAGLEAVRLVARSEGVLLDTTYTGKAMAGLIDLVTSGDISRGATVVFVHTGGSAELFARPADDLLR